MNWVEILAGAFGGGFVGGFLVKIIDIVWLQKVLANNERNQWKRDKKFSVYSRMASDLVSQQGWGKEHRPPELYALLGEALLLIESEELAKKLDGFYKATLDSLKRSSGTRQMAENCGDEARIDEAVAFHAAENNRLQQEARALVARLRQDMLTR